MSTLFAIRSTEDSFFPPPDRHPALQSGRDTESTVHATDAIFIQGFRGETVIGIHDDELHHPQPVMIDLTAGRKRLSACASDQIVDTIDYSAVRQRLVDYLHSHHHRLLEAFAEGLADMVLGEFGADWVQVSVAKPHKFSDVESVGVQIRRERSRCQADAEHVAEILRFLGRGLTPGKIE